MSDVIRKRFVKWLAIATLMLNVAGLILVHGELAPAFSLAATAFVMAIVWEPSHD